MIITVIPKEFLSDVWKDASVFIQKAWDEAPGYYIAADILDRIVTDLEVLWGVFDEEKKLIGAFTTAVEEYPQARILVITALAGENLRDWYEDALTIVRSYAKDQQCSRLEARGRGGWVSYAKRTGWDNSSFVYRFNLKEED